MKENNKGKEILKLLQENYDINSAQDLSSALKDMFKGALQEMMNAEFGSFEFETQSGFRSSF